MTAKKIALIVGMAILIGLTPLVLMSCAVSTEQDAMVVAPRDRMEMVAEDKGMIEAERGPVEQEVLDQEVGEPGLRHVIRRGSVDLAVKDTRAKVDDIREIVREADGIVSSSYIYEIREGQYGARMTLRIPEKHFEAVLDQLETLGKATNVQTELEDVTMQYVDLRSRLNNQIAQEKRLTEILEMAENVEEVLEVERELNRVRGEIESMSARLTQLEDQITFSTINVSLREETIPTGTVSPAPFQNLGERIMHSLYGSINFILNSVSLIILVFAAVIPVLIILALIGLVVWLLVRRSLRRKRKKEDLSEGQA